MRLVWLPLGFTSSALGTIDMADPGGQPNNNRVTTRDLYEALEKQNTERHDMERRILHKIDELCVSVGRQDERIKHNADEIDKLRERSTVTDIAIGIGAAIGTAVSAIIGSRH